MNKLIALLTLAVVAPSCGGTSTVLFTGTDVTGPTGLMVVGSKQKDRIVAGSAQYGFLLALPYAEDWVFEPTDAKPVFGRSTSLRMFATVQGHRPDRAVEEEAYLRDEYLKNLQSRPERKMKDIAITKQGEHFVLEYVTEGSLPDGRPLESTHFWTFRQREDLVVIEAHLSTIHQTDPARAEMCRTLRQILGTQFEIHR